MQTKFAQSHQNPRLSLWQLVMAVSATLAGLIAFFISFEFAGKNSIVIDHATRWLIVHQNFWVTIFCLILMSYGAISPWFKKTDKTLGHYFFSLVKALGLLLALAYVFEFAPEWAMQKMLLPLLFEKIGLMVSVLIPLGAIALSFLVGFGFLEFLGVIFQRLMQTLFRLPGYASLDALSSFVGSYSLGLLVTDECVRTNKYSQRDAVIIATGFSTVSVTFMIVVAATLGLSSSWGYFFISTMATCFLVTAISAWLPPISKLDNKIDSSLNEHKTVSKGNLFIRAFNEAAAKIQANPSLFVIIKTNLINALNMVSILVPSVLAVGFVGLALAQHTAFFDYFGVFLKPVLWLTGLDISSYSGGISASIFEMYLPAMMLGEAPLAAKFIAGVTSISGILYLAGSVPCIFATRIQIGLGKLILIWLVRMHLSVIVASLFYRLGVALNLLG